MTHAIHASVLAVKEALLDASIDTGRAQPTLEELMASDDPVLSGRYHRHLLVR